MNNQSSQGMTLSYKNHTLSSGMKIGGAKVTSGTGDTTHILGGHPQKVSKMGLLGRGLHSPRTRRGRPHHLDYFDHGGCRTRWDLENPGYVS
jgi:hypothetical protein